MNEGPDGTGFDKWFEEQMRSPNAAQLYADARLLLDMKCSCPGCKVFEDCDCLDCQASRRH